MHSRSPKSQENKVTITAAICENQMQINDTLYQNSNTMSLSESGLSAQYKTLAAKKLGRIQTPAITKQEIEEGSQIGGGTWQIGDTVSRNDLPGRELAKHLQSTRPSLH